MEMSGLGHADTTLKAFILLSKWIIQSWRCDTVFKGYVRMTHLGADFVVKFFSYSLPKTARKRLTPKKSTTLISNTIDILSFIMFMYLPSIFSHFE